MEWKAKKHVRMDLRWIRDVMVCLDGGVSSDGREVSIVKCHRLSEMDVIRGVIMGSE